MAENKKNKSGIEKLPESTRRTILWLTVTILMIVIFSFWLTSLPTIFKSETEKNKTENEELEQIQQDIFFLLNKAQKEFSTLGESWKNLTLETTTTVELEPTEELQLTEEEITKIKEKLMNK